MRSIVPHRKSWQFTWLTSSILLSSTNPCNNNYEGILSKQRRKSHFTKRITWQSPDFLMKRGIFQNGRQELTSLNPSRYELASWLGRECLSSSKVQICRPSAALLLRLLKVHSEVTRLSHAVIFVATEMLKKFWNHRVHPNVNKQWCPTCARRETKNRQSEHRLPTRSWDWRGGWNGHMDLLWVLFQMVAH